MKRSILFSIISMAILATACGKEPADDGPKYGDLGIFFDADEFAVEAGGTLEIPFTVTGSEGATLNIEGVCSDQEIKAKTKYNAEYQGTVTLTAPEIVVSDRNVKVTLTASDSHGRSLSKSVDVTVKASVALEVKCTDEIKTMAVKSGGSFTLSYVIIGLAPAKLSGAPKVTVPSGWNSSVAVDGDKFKVTYTAPATPGNSLETKISVSDDHGRSAEMSMTFGLVPFTPATGASNCYIVKPGSTVSINGVKGNSTEKLNFESASLVWQDCAGMVKSVAGNGVDGVIAVELNPGKSGNAVVAAKAGGEVVWSWHLWVTDYDPDADPFVYTSSATSKTYTFMDRNLGAMSNEKLSASSFGLFYQWGRKDPFVGADGLESVVPVKIYDIDGKQLEDKVLQRPVYDDGTTTNLELSIKNPDTFLCNSNLNLPNDWLTNKSVLQKNDLWGGESGLKTIYDPCPEGWTVPESGDCWSFRKEYIKAGKLTDSGKYDPSAAWYCDYDADQGFRYRQDSGKEYWFAFPGHRQSQTGEVYGTGGGAQFHTRETQQTYCIVQQLAWGNPASDTGLNRPYGSSIRCIKE